MNETLNLSQEDTYEERNNTNWTDKNFKLVLYDWNGAIYTIGILSRKIVKHNLLSMKMKNLTY